MIVDYYGVEGCTLETVDEKPVLIAPDDIEQIKIAMNGFEPLPDGRKVHFLSQNEYAYIQKELPYGRTRFIKPLYRSSPRAIEQQNAPLPPAVEPVHLTIYYCGIPCELKESDGKAVLTASQDNGTELLTELEFEPMRDGRWQRNLSSDAYDFIKSRDGNFPIVFGEPPPHLYGTRIWTPDYPTQPIYPQMQTQDSGGGAFLTVISLVLMIGAFSAMAAGRFALFGMLFTGAIVTHSIARVRNPDSTAGKVIGVGYGMITVILMILLIAGFIMCIRYCDNFLSCQWNKC